MTAVVGQSATCSKCGLTTTMPELLKPTQRSFRWGVSGKHLLCPRCTEHNISTGTYVAFLLYFAAACIFIALPHFSAEAAREASDYKFLNLICIGFAFCLPLMVVIHELAHAIVGWAVGLKVWGIQIGIGPRLFRLKFPNKSFFDLHICPYAGLCFTYPGQKTENRWRIAVMIAAGPAVYLIAAFVVAFCATNHFTAIPAVSAWNWWAALFWVNVLMFLSTLQPRVVQIDGLSVSNDVKQLLWLMRSPGAALEWNRIRRLHRVEALLESGDVALARSWFDNLRAGAPNSLEFQLHECFVLGAEGRWKEIYEKASAWRSSSSVPFIRAVYAAWLAVACIYDEREPIEAQQLTAECDSIEPWNPAVQTVQSLVAFAEGIYDDSEELLNRTRGARLGHSAAAAAARIRVEIYRLKNNQRRQRKWLTRAQKLDPNGGYAIPKRWLPDLP